MRKLRKEMGETKWAEYQKERKNSKAMTWRARNVQKVVDWRRRTKEKLITYKGGKCQKCGYDKSCPSAFDFHHRDPTMKEFGIGSKGSTRSFEKLKAEADKCDLLCCRCHAEVHESEYTQQREETKKRYESWLAKVQLHESDKCEKICNQCKQSFLPKRKEQTFCCRDCYLQSSMKK